LQFRIDFLLLSKGEFFATRLKRIFFITNGLLSKSHSFFIIQQLSKDNRMNHIQELLAKNLKSARERLGYTQMKLAELSNISPSFIGEIETGKKFPSSNSLQRIADALGMKPYQLLLDDEAWAVYDKHESITNLYQELKERITIELEQTVKKHLK
jgi:transcriptional regulator with XRE-family HTH domain